MLVDFRPIGKVRSKNPVDPTAALGTVIDALVEESLDLSRVRVVCDWVQYRHNFRDVVDTRPILASHDHESEMTPVTLAAMIAEDEMEIAIDLRRSGDVPIKEFTRELMRARTADGDPSRVYLEKWLVTSESLIWDFNALYWKALDVWEQATGQPYEKTLPGGESDARNRDAVREIIKKLFALWDSLAARNALPDELYVVELGPGNGNQAKAWLDEFVMLDQEHDGDYYRRLHYLMGDYSPHVVQLAQAAVVDHAQHVSAFVLDATQPLTALGFLRYKIFLAYISNVYDNLPADEVGQIGGRTYVLETRAYLTRQATAEIAQLVSAQP